MLSFEDSDNITNTIGSEDYIPDTDGSFDDHIKLIQGEFESPNKAKKAAKKKNVPKNVPN